MLFGVEGLTVLIQWHMLECMCHSTVRCQDHCRERHRSLQVVVVYLDEMAFVQLRLIGDHEGNAGKSCVTEQSL